MCTMRSISIDINIIFVTMFTVFQIKVFKGELNFTSSRSGYSPYTFNTLKQTVKSNKNSVFVSITKLTLYSLFNLGDSCQESMEKQIFQILNLDDHHRQCLLLCKLHEIQKKNKLFQALRGYHIHCIVFLFISKEQDIFFELSSV